MRRCIVLVAITVVAVSTACIDMSAPTGGPASISLLQPPAAFVVAGDVMRDSAGDPIPLRVTAYDGSGAVITGLTPQFFVTDSVKAAHIVNDSLLFGDTLGVVHVVGQVGNLQTAVMAIPVTVAPATLVADSVDTLVAPISGDTAAHGSEPAGATVAGTSGATVQGVIVHFRLLDSLPSNDPARLAAYLVDDQSNVSGIDTTDGTGHAARTVIVVSARIAAGTALPTILHVEATATYRGSPLAGSPAIIAVPVKLGR